MKKFLITLMVIILAVSVGFGVFYLVKDNEVISLKNNTIYKNANDEFEVKLDMKDANSYTTVSVSSSDENVVKVNSTKVEKKKGYASGTFTAVAGGNAKINFKTNNAKFRNIGCDVIVCDGTQAYPYRIESAKDLQRIGAPDETVYTADKYYVLTQDIDLGELDKPFTPIAAFMGSLDGKGYAIKNLTIKDDTLDEVGLFRLVRAGAVVKNIKFENATIEANNQNKSVGVVAGTNEGEVKLIEVKSATITGTAGTANVGGVVGTNKSLNTRTAREIARVDRVSACVTLGSEDKNALGVIGGVVGENKGGVVINSYSKGVAYVKESTLFGGVVGKNAYLQIDGTGTGYDGNLGANIKDCYSLIDIKEIDTTKMGYILAENIDSENVNKIYGNYYVSETALLGLRNGDVKFGTGEGEIEQFGTINAATTNALKNMSKLESYRLYNKKVTVENGEIKILTDETSKTTFYWDIKAWKVDLTQNDGYPILTYVDEYIDDNIGSSSVMNLVDSYEDLNNIRNNLAGSYVISQDIDLNGAEWTPIGTEEAPFTGIVMTTSDNTNGVNIKNLTITSANNKYVGLFGVLGKGATIDGINMVSVNLSGANDFAGAIAGKNNGTISNCSVANGVVSATSAAGGLVGENNGKVCGFTIGNEETELTITKLSRKDANYGAGAVVGINYDTVGGTTSESSGVIGKVLVTSGQKTSLGGVVGHNTGSVSNVRVEFVGNTSDSTKYGVVTTYSASLGGVAGYSTGKISRCYVSATLSAKADDENSYVGGLVGVLNAKEEESVVACVVENTVINGYVSAGAVASLTTDYACKIEVGKENFKFNGAQYASNVGNETKGTITEVAVENTVNLKGKVSGGLVGYFTKGIVRDSYTRALLSAEENAGLVYSISYNSSTGEGGVMFKVYSTASHKQGSSYAVSKSEVHNNWNLGWFVGESESNRSVGFIFDYYYEGSENLKNPKTPDPLGGIYGLFGASDLVYNVRTLSEMKSTSLWGDMLSTSTWAVAEGSLPTIIRCESIKGN